MYAGSIGFEQAAWSGYSAPPPGAVVPFVHALPSLYFTTELTVGAKSGPLDYQFDGFPKTLKSVIYSITLTQLGATNLEFMSMLLCAPFMSITITDNPQLSSLAGPPAIFYSAGQDLISSNNPNLLRPGFQPLGSPPQCNIGPASPLTLIKNIKDIKDINGPASPLTPLKISVAPLDCPNNGSPLSSVDEVCSYLSNGC